MAQKRNWVGYANLAANVVQTVQLDSINSKMRQMGELELQKEYREQQEAALARCEGLLRDAVFFYSEQLRDLEDIAKSNPVAAYIRANHLKRLYSDTPQFKATKFREFEDKERLTNVQRSYEKFIRDSARQQSPDQLEASGRCITYIFEREKLVQLIEARERWEKLAALKESVAKQVAPKLATLQKIKEEQQRTARPFWKKIFAGGKSELEKQAEAIEAEISSINHDVKKEEARFSQRDIEHFTSFFAKYNETNSGDYKKMLRERDTLMKCLLGESVKGLMGDEYFESLENQSPPTARQNQHLLESPPTVTPEVKGAQAALAEWIRIGRSHPGVCIFGPNLPSGGFHAHSFDDAIAAFEKAGLFPANSRQYDDLLDQMVNMGYTFIMIKVPGEIEAIGRVPVETTYEGRELTEKFLGLDKHQKVQHRKTQFGTSRELDVNYVLYGTLPERIDKDEPGAGRREVVSEQNVDSIEKFPFPPELPYADWPNCIVSLTEVPPENKIAVIKALRELLPTLSLADATKMTEKLPCNVVTGVLEAKAKAAVARLTDAGAQAAILACC